MPETGTTSYEQAAGSKRKPVATDFAPVWKPSKPGEWIVGTYKSTAKIRPNNREIDAYYIQLESFDASFVKQKAAVEVRKGDLISLSGKTLAGAFGSIAFGTRVGIRYLGLGEAKSGNNPPKLFAIDDLSGN